LLTDLSPDGSRGTRLADGQTRHRSRGTGTLRVKTPNGRIPEIKDVAFIPESSNAFLSKRQVLKLDDGVWTKCCSKPSSDEKDSTRKLIDFIGTTQDTDLKTD